MFGIMPRTRMNLRKTESTLGRCMKEQDGKRDANITRCIMALAYILTELVLDYNDGDLTG